MRHVFIFVFIALATTSIVFVQAPLRLVQTIEMPEVPAGPYTDHMALDLKGNRLFTTMQAVHLDSRYSQVGENCRYQL